VSDHPAGSYLGIQPDIHLKTAGLLVYIMGALKNGLFAQTRRYAQFILGISTICLRLNFSHAFILNKNPHFSKHPYNIIYAYLTEEQKDRETIMRGTAMATFL